LDIRELLKLEETLLGRKSYAWTQIILAVRVNNEAEVLNDEAEALSDEAKRRKLTAVMSKVVAEG
jgi:hypothetical protein